VHTLQHQLAAAHAAFVTTQQHNQQLSSDNSQLQLQVEAAVREYRANDIICCGLHDTISRLQRALADSQDTCRQQVCRKYGAWHSSELMPAVILLKTATSSSVLMQAMIKSGSEPCCVVVLLCMQVQEISTFAAGMQDLRQCKADLTQQLSGLQQQHQQLQADHEQSLKQLSDTELELQDSKR
jgi:hypothetical protein